MVCAAAAPRARAALPERHAEEPVSYKFDRRRGRRIAASCAMPATFSDNAGRFGVTSVEIVDSGPSGMGIRSVCHIEPGMELRLHSPGCRFPAVTGTVIRCDARDGGYSIGLVVGRPNRAA